MSIRNERQARSELGDHNLMSNDDSTEANVDITFYDNFVPSLHAGEYTITVSQKLMVDTARTQQDGGNAASVPSQPQPPASQKFLVRGPRFIIDPADVHRVFPPASGTGAYDQYVPMIVFNKRMLPWERELRLPDVQNVKLYPWMALLVFAEGELLVPQPATGNATSPQPGSQQNPTRIASLPLSNIIHSTHNGTQTTGPPSGTLGPTIILEDDEDPSQINCNVIEMNVDTFAALIPTIDDLRFLAHVRQVSTQHKEPLNHKHDGWFSVALANRFAIPSPVGSDTNQQRNIAHLVSLEGFEPYLQGDSPVTPSGFQKVRLISLYSWTYICLQDPQENFSELMRGLISSDSEQGTDLLLRMPLLLTLSRPGTVGVTASALTGNVTSIPLAEKTGARAALENNAALEVIDPTGAIREQVTTSDAVAAGAQSIPILAHDFQTEMPQDSYVGPVEAFHSRSPARQIRESNAVGITASDLQGAGITSIALAGSAQALEKAAGLEVVSSTGAIRKLVTTSDAVAAGAQSIPIVATNFDTKMTAGSAVGASADFQVLDRLQDGYVPLSYATQTGEQTFAWYRGPLAPVVTTEFLETTSSDQPENPSVPLNTSEAMVYDPATGLFDQSYAVAFQTGRSLGLASLPFATNLLEWRRTAHRLVDLLLEYMRSPHLKGILQRENILDPNGNLTDVGVTDLAELLDANIVSNAFKDFLATEFADNIATLIGQTGGFTPQDQQQTPTNPTTRQPPAPADLSNLMNDPVVVSLLHQVSGLEVPDGSSADVEIGIMPDQLVGWLAQTALLYKVPFNNLVPSERMLPQESIRFFYIDPNWIDSLLDGALSVGIQSSRDSLFHRITRDALHRAVDAVLHQVRDKLRGVDSSAAPPPLGSMAGFILRSAVVSGWQGLEVRAWSAADGTNPMKPLRLDRVAPSVMIGIFPDVPVKIEFNEPSEGLVFGLEDEGIDLRYLPGTSGATGSNIGQYIEPKITLSPGDLPRRAGHLINRR